LRATAALHRLGSLVTAVERLVGREKAAAPTNTSAGSPLAGETR
jgi:hypothetical protein